VRAVPNAHRELLSRYFRVDPQDVTFEHGLNGKLALGGRTAELLPSTCPIPTSLR